MDHEMNGKRVHMYSDKQDREHHTHQETRSREELHTCDAILVIILFYFIFDLLLFCSFSHFLF